MISFENTDQILQRAWDGLSDVENIQNERDGNAKQPRRRAGNASFFFYSCIRRQQFQGHRSFFFFFKQFFLLLISIISTLFVTEVGLSSEISQGSERSPHFTGSIWTVDRENRRSEMFVSLSTGWNRTNSLFTSAQTRVEYVSFVVVFCLVHWDSHWQVWVNTLLRG